MPLRFSAVMLFVLAALVATSCSVGAGSSATTADGIRAYQAGGVWVFEHNSENYMDALHGGYAEVIDRCLYVDGTIVVWHAQDTKGLAAALAAAGTGRLLTIAGGGLSTEEGAAPEDLPDTITERCGTAAVWYAAP